MNFCPAFRRPIHHNLSPAVGKPNHRISQIYAMSNHMSIKHLGATSYERRSATLQQNIAHSALFARPSWTHDIQALHGLSGNRKSATAGSRSIKHIAKACDEY